MIGLNISSSYNRNTKNKVIIIMENEYYEFIFNICRYCRIGNLSFYHRYVAYLFESSLLQLFIPLNLSVFYSRIY